MIVLVLVAILACIKSINNWSNIVFNGFTIWDLEREDILVLTISILVFIVIELLIIKCVVIPILIK